MLDMKARTFAFAVNVGKLIAALPITTVNSAHVKNTRKVVIICWR